MRIYEIAEVSPGRFAIGHWKTRWFGLRKPKWVSTFTFTFTTVHAAVNYITDFENKRRAEEREAREYPREVCFGHVANDGQFHRHRLREGD